MERTRIALSTLAAVVLLAALAPAHAAPAPTLPVLPVATEAALDALFQAPALSLPADPLGAALPDACFFDGGSCKSCPGHTTAQPCRTVLCEGQKYTSCGACQTDCVPPTS